ncbi:MAG TPA: TauD/TfdA family dioxygenase [Longimicrobium sp.]|jgi:alpha-ketoglutarate-dependent taurine dioxygenase
MSDSTSLPGRGPGGPGSLRRKPVSVTQEALVRAGRLDGSGGPPLLVTPAAERLRLAEWAASGRGWIEEQLLAHGALLFRGFTVGELDEVEAFMRALTADLLAYTYRSTPRTQVKGSVYTSTEYPADQVIPIHNEMSYTRSWPMKIAFYCVQAAPRGGETPIADSRRVLARLDPALVERFERLGVMYVRNYTRRLDLPWQEVFQTDSRSEVEAFCARTGMSHEWIADDHLRTWQVCQATAVHPRTGEAVWFNQAHLFHVSSLPPALRDALLAEFPEEELPRNTYYGDGSPIEPGTLAAIRAAWEAESVRFPWEEGDVLLLDNMMFAHGREAFEGPRKVVVVMAEAGGEPAAAETAAADAAAGAV